MTDSTCRTSYPVTSARQPAGRLAPGGICLRLPGLIRRWAFQQDKIGGSKTMPHSLNEDQVARRADFSKAHPEVTFEFRYETGQWEATYPTGGNGTQAIYDTELRRVLDELEKRLG
jgi:hypothetical protein